MRVYLLRNASAEGGKAAGLKKLRLRLVVRGLRRLKIRPEMVLSSAARPAWETALVVARDLTPRRPPVKLEALERRESAAAIWSALQENSEVRSILLVGPEPVLAELAGFLLQAPRLSLNLKKAGLLRVERGYGAPGSSRRGIAVVTHF